MIRLYRNTIEHLLLLAVYEQEYEGRSITDITERLRHHQVGAGPSAKRRQDLFNFARKSLLASASTNAAQEVIELLYKKLEDESKGRDQDLIDRIVATLQLPYCRNTFSGETMRRLRQALLLPTESAGLIARLARKEMACVACGHDLHHGESVTISQDESGASTLTCHRCMAPTCVSCASCEGSAALSEKAQSSMSRMVCEACQAKGTKSTEKKKETIDWVRQAGLISSERLPQATAAFTGRGGRNVTLPDRVAQERERLRSFQEQLDQAQQAAGSTTGTSLNVPINPVEPREP